MNNIQDFICNNIINPTTNIGSHVYRKLSFTEENDHIDVEDVDVSISPPLTYKVKKIQTLEDYSSDNIQEVTTGKFKRPVKHLTITIPEKRTSHMDKEFNYEIDGDSYFKHLNFAGQGYFCHFKAAMGYSWRSFKASCCFFIHALWPDVFQQTGSNEIINLGDELIQKYKNRINYLSEHYN